MSTKRDRRRARRAGVAQRLVAGGPFRTLAEDLLSFEWEREEDGMVRVHAIGLSPAFVRARMRVEAELLLADADALATESQLTGPIAFQDPPSRVPSGDA